MIYIYIWYIYTPHIYKYKYIYTMSIYMMIYDIDMICISIFIDIYICMHCIVPLIFMSPFHLYLWPLQIEDCDIFTLQIDVDIFGFGNLDLATKTLPETIRSWQAETAPKGNSFEATPVLPRCYSLVSGRERNRKVGNWINTKRSKMNTPYHIYHPWDYIYTYDFTIKID